VTSQIVDPGNSFASVVAAAVSVGPVAGLSSGPTAAACWVGCTTATPDTAGAFVTWGLLRPSGLRIPMIPSVRPTSVSAPILPPIQAR